MSIFDVIAIAIVSAPVFFIIRTAVSMIREKRLS
jgi:hypothetical protein